MITKKKNHKFLVLSYLYQRILLTCLERKTRKEKEAGGDYPKEDTGRVEERYHQSECERASYCHFLIKSNGLHFKKINKKRHYERSMALTNRSPILGSGNPPNDSSHSIWKKVTAEVSWNFPPCIKVFAYIIL